MDRQLLVSARRSTCQVDRVLSGRLYSEEPVEKRAIALERLPQVFGVNVLPPIPLFLQLLALGCELLSDPFNYVGDKTVCVFDRRARFIDE